MRNQLLRDRRLGEHGAFSRASHAVGRLQFLADLAPVVPKFGHVAGKTALAQAPSIPLPAEVIERSKTGFVVPMRQWMDGALRGGDQRGSVGEWSRATGRNMSLRRSVLVLISARNAPELTSRRVKILALVPEAFGGFGGIAQYNRDLMSALAKDTASTKFASFRAWRRDRSTCHRKSHPISAHLSASCSRIEFCRRDASPAA